MLELNKYSSECANQYFMCCICGIFQAYRTDMIIKHEKLHHYQASFCANAKAMRPKRAEEVLAPLVVVAGMSSAVVELEVPGSIEVPGSTEVPDPMEVPGSIEVPGSMEVPGSIEVPGSMV